MSTNLRSSLIRLASAHPELRADLLPLLREAAYPREGQATIQLRSNGFTVYYRITRSPSGLAAEEMPKLGLKARASFQTFVLRLSEGLGVPLSEPAESHYVLLGVANGSITFNVEGSVKVLGRKKLTKEMVESLESSVFSRWGYEVDFM